MTEQTTKPADPKDPLDHDGDGKKGGAAKAPTVGGVRKKGAPPAPKPAGEKASDLVAVRITKKGQGEVHDGEGGTYDFEDEVYLEAGSARDLEERGLAEVVG